MEELKVTSIDKGTHVIVFANGRLMGPTDGEQLNAAFEGLLGLGKMKFVLDLAGLEYMNSTGLNILLRQFTRIRNNGGELLLGTMSGKVSQLLVITKLNAVFKVYPSTDEAEATFSGN